MTTELPSQIGLAAAASYLIQYLKNSPKFSWISGDTGFLNRALAVVASFIAAVGIHYSWTHGTDEGVYVITLTGLTFSSIYHYGWSWFCQFCIQQGYFQAVVKQPSTVRTMGESGVGTAVVAVSPATAGEVVAKDKP